MSTKNLQVGSAGLWRPARLARHRGDTHHLGLGVASAVLLALCSGAAVAADPPPDTTLPTPPPPATLGTGKTIVVKDTALEDARLGLDEISGGTSLITAADVEDHRAATQADLLAEQPGVFAQSAGGEDAIKISIRGSGLNRGTGFFRSGVLFTFDGLPVTGPSGTPFELFEPLGLQYTEILRGGNAFDRGALALGGAINYVSNTGLTAPGGVIRLEGGSFGYFKGQVAYGSVDGPVDEYISLTGSVRDGFSVHSDAEDAHVNANIGWQVNPDLETRFFFRFGYADFAAPGYLTRAQIIANPAQANPNYLSYDYRRRQPGSEFIGNETTYKLDTQSSIEVGADFQNFPIDIGATGPNAAPSDWTYGNVSEHVKYTHSDQLLGDASVTEVALYSSTDVYGSVDRFAGVPGSHNYGTAAYPYYLVDGQKITTNQFGGSSDNVLLVTNDLEISKDLWLTAGLAGSLINRDIAITYPVSDRYSSSHVNYEPKLGLRYDFSPDLQVFANVTKTVEPRNDWAGVITPQNDYGQFAVLNLKDQTAWTEEIGGRAREGIFQGSLSYYHSQVTDELLQAVIDPTAGITSETNASPTTHQGVELALETLLWQEGGGGWAAGNDTSGQRIIWRQAYTWSDFHFNDDPVFGHNQLPGLPEHYYQGDISYEHPSGFHAGITAQYASGYFVDYANSFRTNPYALFGAQLGYTQPGGHGWDVSLDLRNLTNKHYAADITPGYNDHGEDLARSDAGDGFGVFTAVSYRF